MKTLAIALCVSTLLLAGCNEHKSEAKQLNSAVPAATPEQAPVGGAFAVHSSSAKKPPVSKPQTSSPHLSKFYQVFHDGAFIDPKGKPMLLVFGQPQDPYTQKLQRDVATDAELAAALEKDVTPIYIDATSNKRHKFFHNGEAMDVDTKTLVSIYHIEATPTLIFTDEKGKTIFIVPSYLPPKKFELVLGFIHEGLWRGKNRENGEVEKALKAYFKAHGIAIGGKK